MGRVEKLPSRIVPALEDSPPRCCSAFPSEIERMNCCLWRARATHKAVTGLWPPKRRTWPHRTGPGGRKSRPAHSNSGCAIRGRGTSVPGAAPVRPRPAALPAGASGLGKAGRGRRRCPCAGRVRPRRRLLPPGATARTSRPAGPRCPAPTGLFQRPLEESFGHRMIAHFRGQEAGGGQNFRLVRGHSHRPFKTTFRLGKLITQAMISRQLGQDLGIGRRQPVGALQQFKALLKIAPLPGFFGLLEHPVQRAGGNQLRAFHVVILDLRYAISRLRT